MHRRTPHPRRIRTGAAAGALTLAAALVTVLPPPAAAQAASYDAGTAFVTGGSALTAATAGDPGHASVSAGGRVTVPVFSTADGVRPLTLTYDNPTGRTLSPALVVDGLPAGSVDLPPTDGWGEVSVDADLAAGTGSVALHHDGPGAFSLRGVEVADAAALAERGATVPYTVHQAEDGSTNGEVLGPDRAFRTVAAEASGRRAVRLSGTGDFVEFTLTEPADALVVRYSIPDAPGGGGERHPLGLYVDGEKVDDLELTSEYSWVYGDYPYHDDPGLGGAQRFFDDSRFRVGPLPAGAVLRLEKDPGSTAAHYDIDLVETESVPAPRPRPDGFVDITDHGATSGDGTDDTSAVRAAIAAAHAAGTGVWVPGGDFTITARIEVAGVAVRGAGPWYSVLHGRDGRGGFFATGSDVVIADLMIDGDNRYRDDAGFDAALEGDFGTGSLIQNVWVEHTKVGLWADHGTDGLLALGLRIRNTFADGVNLHGNVRNTEVRQSVLRNTGDDALAMWSDGAPVTDSAFVGNTVHTPLLGNGAGIYGGHGNRVADSVVEDTLTGSAGVAVGTRFAPVPLSGETVVENTTLRRTGGYEPNWATQLGAVWIFADSADITAPITVRDVDVLDSTHQGILVSHDRLVEDLTFTRVRVDGTGGHGIELNARGGAFFEHVSVSGVAGTPLTAWDGFDVVRGEGNSGF
ncbi:MULTISPECIES: glycosyl hydrolase family 28-related protein [unclassified Nocardiopsis]|uniref:glycosyl hydrolase family 28-related protein n=1 Tax=Nocardiopsis TaxID=2013 RepID=UPI00387B2C91